MDSSKNFPFLLQETFDGSFNRMSKTSLWQIAVSLVLQIGLFTSMASADRKSPTYRNYKGQVLFQSAEFGAFSSEEEFASAAKRAKSVRVLKRDQSNQWSVYFMAFMKTHPGANRVNLVWYDPHKKPAEQIDYTEFVVAADEVVLQGNVVISPDQGFKPGNSYEVRITRLIGNRETVYARSTIQLK